MRRAVLTGTLLLTFGLALASSAMAAPTRASYIKQADALCKSGNAKLAVLKPTFNRINYKAAGGLQKAVTLFGKALKIEDATYQQILALPKPAGDAATLTRVWGAVGAETAALKRTVNGIRNLDKKAIKKGEQQTDAAEAKYKRLAQSYGFHYCGVH